MHFVISLKTSLFDLSKEEENPINPIFGKSLLSWIKDKASNQYQIDEPDAEDWGWYSYIDWNGRQYLLGATAYFEEGDDPTSEIEYIFQLDKFRSLKEKLLGREKMTPEDECLSYIKGLFDAEPSIIDIKVE